MRSLSVNRRQLKSQATQKFELLATETIIAPNPADPLNYYVMGVGIRIAVRRAIASGQAGFSMGGLSASATLRGTATAFKLGALGIGIAGLDFVDELQKQSLSGAFSLDTLQLTGSAVRRGDGLPGRSRSSGQPHPRVGRGWPRTQVESAAASFGFALRGISYRVTLSDMLRRNTNPLPPGVDRSDVVLWATYTSILQTPNPLLVTPCPTQSQLTSSLIFLRTLTRRG